MGAELGRISGPLLANNLVRNGVDLSFRNLQSSPDLLYLNVVDGRIGVNTSGPGSELDVPVKIRSTGFKVDTLSSIGNYTVSTNQIINGLGIIYIQPAQVTVAVTTTASMNNAVGGNAGYFFRTYGPLHTAEGYDRIEAGWVARGAGGVVIGTVVSNVPDPADNNESCTITISGGNFVQNTFYYFTGTVVQSDGTITSPGLTTDDLQFSSNLIQSTTPDTNIELYPTGTGKINLNPGSDVYIDADLHVTGNITFDGNITLGNEDTDNIVFAADVNSSIMPSTYPSSNLTDENDNILIAENGTDTLVDAPDFNFGSATKRWKTTYSNLTNAGYVDADATTVNSMYTGNLLISGSTFSNTISANPIYLTPNGAGQVVFNNVDFFDLNSIVNNSNGALTIASTRYGYSKFTGTAGITIPIGTTDNRPTPVSGYLRYNSEIGAAEIYNGTDWIPAIGTSPVLTIDDVYDVMDEWTLILG
jgi:hypothetical protein